MAVNEASKFNVTTKNQHYCEFQWCIDGFSGIDGELISPAFRAAEGCHLMWKIILELHLPYHKYEMKIKFETSDKRKKINALFFYKIYAGDYCITTNSTSAVCISHVINKNTGIVIFKPRYSLSDGWSCNGANYCSLPCEPDQIKFEGNLTISSCCQEKPKKVEMTNKYLPQLQIDLKSMLKNQEFTDVALNVGNETLRANKSILCARSPVFKIMFEQNFIEAVENSVDIKDMEKSVLEKFLEFLYSGVVEDREFKTVAALYSAADKYEVKTLQDARRKILTSCMSESTAPVILKLADMHNDKNLKEIAILYISDHFDKVELTTEWGHLLDTDPRLSSYTLRKVSTNMSK